MYHDFMKNGSGAVIHLVKLINTADPVVTQNQCTAGKRHNRDLVTLWNKKKKREELTSEGPAALSQGL